jgi:hypothetical protein
MGGTEFVVCKDPLHTGNEDAKILINDVLEIGDGLFLCTDTWDNICDNLTRLY